MANEFLVIFPILVGHAKKFGLELIYKKNFKQYYDDMTSDKPTFGE